MEVLLLLICVVVNIRAKSDHSNRRGTCKSKFRRQLVVGLRRYYNQKYIGNPNSGLFPNAVAYNSSTLPYQPTCFHQPNHVSRTYRETTVTGEKNSSKCGQPPISNDIRDLSSCPWYYVAAFDNSMRPRSVMHARCRCRSCGDFRQKGSCQEVYVPTPVLKRIKIGKWLKPKWRPAIIQVSVACVCIRNS